MLSPQYKKLIIEGMKKRMKEIKAMEEGYNSEDERPLSQLKKYLANMSILSQSRRMKRLKARRRLYQQFLKV